MRNLKLFIFGLIAVSTLGFSGCKALKGCDCPKFGNIDTELPAQKEVQNS